MMDEASHTALDPVILLLLYGVVLNYKHVKSMLFKLRKSLVTLRKFLEISRKFHEILEKLKFDIVFLQVLIKEHL